MLSHALPITYNTLDEKESLALIYVACFFLSHQLFIHTTLPVEATCIL